MLILVAAGRPWAPAAYIFSGSSWSPRKALEAGRGCVLASQKRALLLLLLAGHVPAVLRGHGGCLRTPLLPLPALAGPREGGVTKPRTPDRITIVLFVPAVSV
jgi:hypothetical protein